VKNSPKTLSTIFGDSLRKLRNERQLSQEEFALLCGLDRTYISGLERGTRNPTLKVLDLIATSLDISISELLSEL
jgi:transcriptional regulator with XRE-family HTH domain